MTVESENICTGLGHSKHTLFILTSVGEVGDDSCDPSSRSGSAGVYHDQQLHELVVDLTGSGGLEDENFGNVACE